MVKSGNVNTQYVMNRVSTNVHISKYPSSAVIATGSAATSCGKHVTVALVLSYPSSPCYPAMARPRSPARRTGSLNIRTYFSMTVSSRQRELPDAYQYSESIQGMRSSMTNAMWLWIDAQEAAQAIARTFDYDKDQTLVIVGQLLAAIDKEAWEGQS